jgi:acetyl-CoA synthetase
VCDNCVLAIGRAQSTNRKHALRSLGSGGETLGEDLLDWGASRARRKAVRAHCTARGAGRSTFGVTINEFYGQTECNLILSNCAPLFPGKTPAPCARMAPTAARAVRVGSMGKPVPGKTVAIIDENGNPLPTGAAGDIAVRKEGGARPAAAACAALRRGARAPAQT